MTEKQESHSNYKGFVAGVFSGIAKLSGMSKPHSARPSSRFRLESFWNDILEDSRHTRRYRPS
jgi:hypothetical protein